MKEKILPYDPSLREIVAEYDRPAGPLHQSRSRVSCTGGMVATSQPLAAEVGLDILQAGGNAADAAIAANAMLGLVEPMSCGVGGDLFVMYWDSATRQLHGMNASGRSPYALSLDTIIDQQLKEIPENGPFSWSVPGCVDGWAKLLERFGTLPLDRLLQPAITYGRNGFPVSDIVAHSWTEAMPFLEAWPDSARTFLPRGRAPHCGELFQNPWLANCYDTIAADGADVFYRGTIADQIVRFSQANGGFLAQADFQDHRSEWVEPVSTNYRGYDVWQLPPNGQGMVVLQMLNILEGFDLRSLGRGSADYLHVLVEAKKLAFADRAKYYSDPAFDTVPVAELVAKPYSDSRRRQIDLHQASRQVCAGDPRLDQGDTVYLTAVDGDRNCCSLIQSNFQNFGSKVTPGQLGFALQNRGCLFALDAQHRNCLRPHKRPFHTIIPGMVTRMGRPWLCFGVMGGDMQPQGQTQVLINMIDFDMDVQQAGDAARVRHMGSQTPTGKPMDNDGGAVAVESGIPAEAVDGLQRRGHRIVMSPGTFGGYQAIMIDQPQGTLHGGTEPRKDGAAVGY